MAARRKNTKPTAIYVLFDMRAETIAEGWLPGKPFYCGKTVQKPEYRFNVHRQTMALHPNRPISKWLRDCGAYIRVTTIEIVPIGEDWAERERYWIARLREVVPNCANVSRGGDGAPGNIRSAASRARMSLIMTGKTHSVEARAKMSARMRGTSIRKGKKASPEVCAHFSAMRTGVKRGPQSVEHREKIAAAQRGRKFSEVRKAALRAAWVRRKARSVVDSRLVS